MDIHEDRLRKVIEHLIRTQPRQAGLNTALRKMLEGGKLTYTWGRNGSKTIKVWSTNGGPELEGLVADIKNDVQAAFLGLFIQGRIVFTTDMKATPEIRFFDSSCIPTGVQSPQTMERTRGDCTYPSSQSHRRRAR